METFTFKPTLESSSGSVKPRTLSAQYGDGYRQVVGDGINNLPQTWSLQFSGDEDEIKEIKAFLDARAGYDPFYWKPPFSDSTLIWTAADYSMTPKGGRIWNLSVDFTQFFGA